DHPWLGIGSGNFKRLYPRYMAATASEKVSDPHNFALEIWATSGMFTLLVFLLTLGLFFRHIWRLVSGGVASGKSPQPPTPTHPSPLTTHQTATHQPPWAFYLGGMTALILGFVLRAGDVSDLLSETALSAARVLVWFPAFAMFMSVPWTGPGRTLALAAGV